MFKNNILKCLLVVVSILCSSFIQAEETIVRITSELAAVEVMHQGKPVTIMRNQDLDNQINPAFTRTSRRCPPFCVTPISLGNGVQTYGELEVLNSLQKMALGHQDILLVDNRTPEWFMRGTIPGAVNVPFHDINREFGANDASINAAMASFDAHKTSQGWDFSKAKTLVMFCNGIWCGQSSKGIDALLAKGYPVERIKWYRGGMQDWETLGLTSIIP